MQLAQKEGISLQLSESLVADDRENNDRELIADFLSVVKDVQKALVGMEKKNEEMRDIADKQIKENKASS